MVAEASRCCAVRKDGTPCQALALASSPAGHCWAHDVGNQAKVRQVRQAGGHGRASKARAEKLMPALMRPVLYSLLGALRDVRSEEITPQQANAMAALAGAVVKVYTSGQLEERLSALEAVQPPQPPGRGRPA